MRCRDCPRFDSDAQTCQDQKLNPGRWEEAVEVGQLYGIRSICTFNDFRERLIAARANPVSPQKPFRLH
ncbi:MAG: hypothetical protein KF812_08720 [Fimbriimonadaceae bacterium]|nr:hypothetical protein [Fimbriimonadaceae bacterium]